MTSNQNQQTVILAAEDDKLTGIMLLKMLQKHGYHTTLVTDGQQALAAFSQLQPDLVLLDALMPELDGITACRLLKQLPGGEHTPVLMVTGLQDNQSVQQAFEAGASDYITKPVHWAVLHHRIERLVQARRAWQALRASEERFRQVINSISDHIYVTEVTKEGRLINQYISPNLEKLLGYPIASITTDWSFWADQLIHPEDRPAARQQLKRLLAGQFSEVEYRMKTAAQNIIWVRDSARVEHTNGACFIYGVVSDISSRKQAEESLRASQKLAELGTLAAGIAHEINSPLQVITGVSESLLKRHQEERLTPEFLARKLEVIHRNGWRCAEIVRSLKTYAHSAPAKVEPHRLNEIVQDTLLLIEHQLTSWNNVTVSTQLAGELPPFSCDRNQIAQIIINLLTNARDAMPEGGQITLTTGFDAGAGRLELRVADTGHGIPAALQAKIFDPFFTTKPLDKGTGLGLSIIAGIVQAHGGTIAVNSAPDVGTEFILYFPPEPPSAAVLTPPLAQPAGRFDDLVPANSRSNGAGNNKLTR